ncbi:MAG: C39 family peptidase [Helicobacteraceae bacterium]|nr:C39 family peptidase [Helicobacteraceae bacterium]
MKTLSILLFYLSLWSEITIQEKEFTLHNPIRSWIEFKNDKLTRQRYDYSCGSAALSTLLSYYYDANVSELMILESVLEAKGIKEEPSELENQKGLNGLSFYELSQYASAQGFKAIGIALSMQELKKLQIPAIVFVKIRKQEHFTVLKKMDERYAYLADPSFGNIRVNHAKFEEMFFTYGKNENQGKILAILTKDGTAGIQDFKAIEPFPKSLYESIANPLR